MMSIRVRWLMLLAIVWSRPSCVVSTAAAARDDPARPNVVLIMADDIGYECFGCYGSRQYQTPHIDRLARQGMRFNHCHAQPLCTPSRVKLMTGVSNARNYSAFSILNRDQRTIGQYFQAAGYRTMIGGKWQLFGAEHYPPRFQRRGTLPREAGFDATCLWQVDRLGSRYWQPLLNIDGEDHQFDKEKYGPDIVNQAILDFIEANRQRSFFVYYPMLLTHHPFVPTPDSESRQSKDLQRNFEDMTAAMDKLVGRVVDKIDELGLAERTLILFIGDNGSPQPIRSMLANRKISGGKGKTTDAGTHVPLVARWPGVVPQGRVCNDLVDFSDFLPTVLEASGIAVPKGLDGKSFLRQLRGERGQPRSWIYCFYCPRPEKTRPVRFVRDQRWKLYGDGRFFDVEHDPDEKQPLADLAANSPAAQAQEKLAVALQSMPAEGQMLLKIP